MEKYDYVKPPKKLPSQELRESIGYKVPSPSQFGFKSPLGEARALEEEQGSCQG